MTEPQVCDVCKRKLVTERMLAKAVHSGCALTGERHELDDCPNKQYFTADAKMLWKHMDGQDSQK